MKTIKLTKGKEAMVDDEDFDFLNQWKWHTLTCANGLFYATRTVNGSHRHKVLMHRVILGLTDKSIKGDHRDHNGLNNQRDNLRVATHAQNMQNRRPAGKSKYLGVSIEKKNKYTTRFIAVIGVNRKRIKLGNFRVEEDAARAYDRAAKENFGEFANLNFK